MRFVPISVLGAAIALTACSTAAPARPPRTADNVPLRPASLETPAPRAAAASRAAPAAPANTNVYEMLITAPPTITKPPCDLYTVLTPRGIAIEFVANRQPIAELRAQVQRIAARLNDGHITGLERRRLFDNAATFGVRSILALGPIATMVPTEAGARLQIDASDPDDVTALRAHVLWHSADFLPGVRNLEEACPTVPGAPATLAAPGER